jgi:arylsulfatase A-like enzyme
MSGTLTTFLARVLPPRRRLWRGAAIAAGLWLFFMVATAYTSAVTLLDRVASTDVMRAASSGAWTSRIGWEAAYFVAAQILLHLVFAVVTWLMAVASAIVSPVARIKFGAVLTGWFCVLAAAVLAYNALWYPRTLIGAYYHDAVATKAAGFHAGQIVYFIAFGLCALILLAAGQKLIQRAEPTVRQRAFAVSVTVGLAGATLFLWPSEHAATATASNSAGRPHIIIIGIDSLRLEQLRRFGGTGVTPNIDRFLEKADLFSDTTTPLGRTFSSWTAILTGRSPTVTGARFNLAERSGVRANPTVGDVMQQAGYHTVYSTDEVRFANIDESFGFDQVVTPRIGAADFILGTYNELPLASVVINTRVGKWLFPFSYANRGVATMFEPETFVERLYHEVSFEQPTLFISHLTATHWPYYTADTPFGVSARTSEHDRPMYRIGLKTVDRMFGEMLAMLEAKGALRNALVLVLSDHGEALGLPSDSFFEEATFRVEGLKAPLKMDDFGHGQSVLSQSQYHVLLGFKIFGGKQNFGIEGQTFPYPATVEDIAPTILDFLKIGGDPLAATGSSLLQLLESGNVHAYGDPERIRFTETDLRVLPAPGGGVDEDGTARHNSAFFEVDPATARLHIKPAYAPLATAYKERAAFTHNQLLAALPAGPFAHQYVYLDLGAKHGRLLMSRPNDDEPVAQRLWDALVAHYQGELKAPVTTTREDWPRIAAEWTAFSNAAAFNGRRVVASQ